MPVATPIIILAPIDTDRKGPKIKDKATSSITAKVIGCAILRQNANRYRLGSCLLASR